MRDEDFITNLESEIKGIEDREDIDASEKFHLTHHKKLYICLARDADAKLYRVTTGYDYIATNGFRGTFITDYYMVAHNEDELRSKWNNSFKIPIISLRKSEGWEIDEVLLKNPGIYQIT